MSHTRHSILRNIYEYLIQKKNVSAEKIERESKIVVAVAEECRETFELKIKKIDLLFSLLLIRSVDSSLFASFFFLCIIKH